LNHFSGSKCDRTVLAKTGVCINLLTPGSVPNWPGAPKTHLSKPTHDLVPAPLCEEDDQHHHACYCDRGHTAVRFDIRGRPRGNCTGVQFDSLSARTDSWCFLKNIPDPDNHRKQCFKDAQWSYKDGRFYSYKACTVQSIPENKSEIQQHEFNLMLDLNSNNLEDNHNDNNSTKAVLESQEGVAQNISEKISREEGKSYEVTERTSSWFNWIPSVF